MGMGSYLNELGLGERETYDAQGNSFDPQAVAIRLWAGLHEWALGGAMARHVYPVLEEVVESFRTVREYIDGRGLVGCLRPFPHDLYDQLLQLDAPAHLSGTAPDASIPAAEHGRRAG